MKNKENNLFDKNGNLLKDIQTYPNVCILTLSSEQKHTDLEISKGILQPFLMELTAKYKFTPPLIFAEKQENGNILFKLVYKTFIHWQVIRDLWNKYQNQKGFNYVDAYSNKMKTFFKDGFKMFPNDTRSEEKQLKAYTEAKKSGWMKPNSTDVVAMYKCKCF